MKKILIIILSTICGLFVAFEVGMKIYIHNVEKKNEELFKNSDYYKNCEAINKYNVNIMIYGEEHRQFDYLKPSYISSLKEISWDNDYNVLIVNDLYSETTMDESDYQMIKDVVSTGENKLIFYYYGNKKFNQLLEYELLTTKPLNNSLGMIYGPSKYHNAINYYTEDFESDQRNSTHFEQILAFSIVDDYLSEVI